MDPSQPTTSPPGTAAKLLRAAMGLPLHHPADNRTIALWTHGGHNWIMNIARLFRRRGQQETKCSPKPEPTGLAELTIQGGKALNLSNHAALEVGLMRDGLVVAELNCIPAAFQWEQDVTNCVVEWSNRADTVRLRRLWVLVQCPVGSGLYRDAG